MCCLVSADVELTFASIALHRSQGGLKEACASWIASS
jgi:hypothetical protein